MKIFNAELIREADRYTIENTPIASADLMERAANVFVDWFIPQYTPEYPVCIFAGIGNNGGDGLVVSRLLVQNGYRVRVFICRISPNTSEDFAVNLERLKAMRSHDLEIVEINKGAAFPDLVPHATIIDAIFGSGLNRPVGGYWLELVQWMNGLDHSIVAIDVPSGLFADQPTPEGTAVEADRTLSFELPKYAFFMPENARYAGHWSVRSIGLSTTFIEQAAVRNFYMTRDMVTPLLHSRNRYDHKGIFGHALCVMGSFGKAGAAVLGTTAALRSGAGLVTAHIPQKIYDILQTTTPEAMVSLDPDAQVFTKPPPDLDRYHTLGIGCGLGTEKKTAAGLRMLLQEFDRPVVLDADALNLLAKHTELRHLVPEESILTPHFKEFERLFGPSSNHFERLETLRSAAQDLRCNIILKGAHTAVATAKGEIYFNSTGNPGMATAGSGDVLSGILTGLLAQGYTGSDAARTGVYLHGLAGDFAAADLGHEALIAGDITDYLAKAFRTLHDAGQV